MRIITHTGFSEKQFNAFWRAFGASCQAQGIASKERDSYRKRIMMEECGAEHMSELSRTRHYDNLMLRISLDAQDYEQAARYVSGNERRLAALVEACASQLMQIQGTDPASASAYVAGIIEQAGFPIRKDGNTYWMDLVLWQIGAVFKALDTHRRRLLAADGIDIGVKFDIGVGYARRGDGRIEAVQHTVPPPTYFRVKV